MVKNPQKPSDGKVTITIFELLMLLLTVASMVAGATYLIFKDKYPCTPCEEKIPSAPSHDTTLTLIGSGTVYNFIRINIPDLLDASVMVFSGPTLTALNMLARKERSISVDFSCIGMAATMVTRNDLMDEAQWEDFKKDDNAKKMVALRIAEEPLQVGVFLQDSECFKSLTGNTVGVAALLSLVKNCDATQYRIFSTSQPSGTKMEYLKLFKREDPSFIEIPKKCISEFDLFLQTWNGVEKSNKPSLFLGSKYYSYENIKQLKIIDSGNHEAIRSLYLYFAVSQSEKSQNGIYRVSGKKGKFLTELKHRIRVGKPDDDDSTFFVPDQSNTDLIMMDLLK